MKKLDKELFDDKLKNVEDEGLEEFLAYNKRTVEYIKKNGVSSKEINKMLKKKKKERNNFPNKFLNFFKKWKFRKLRKRNKELVDHKL